MKNAVFIFITLLSCQSPEVKNGNDSSSTTAQPAYRCIDLIALNRECLDIDSIRISGNLPVETTIQGLLSVLGRPDTVISIPPDFINIPKGDFDRKMIYYRDIKYYTLDESAHIQSINFDGSDMQVVHPKITLDKNTTIKDLQTVFPLSGYLLHGSGENTFNGFVELRSSRRWYVGAVWFLIFKRSKLVRLDFIEPY